jgi:protein-S-isoprenylcysteine O-methyltransferase Ste14
MERKTSTFKRIFGSGPAGLVISLVLLFLAGWINTQIDLPSLSDNRFLLNALFMATGCVTLIIIVWSFKSLLAADRGNKLCTSGAFRYVRHPLYAAFLSVFNFGLVIWLNSYVFVLWALLLHPIWHYLVRDEEQMMIDIFGETYIEYQKKTGRFFPRLIMKRTE